VHRSSRARNVGFWVVIDKPRGPCTMVHLRSLTTLAGLRPPWPDAPHLSHQRQRAPKISTRPPRGLSSICTAPHRTAPTPNTNTTPLHTRTKSVRSMGIAASRSSFLWALNH
jgi:hypothetical protein